jgi:hypothetical protein
MRRFRALCVVLVLILAGCGAPVARSPSTDAPPDPSKDVQGWEDGNWYDETIAIDDSDGLNATERRELVDRAMARVEHVRGVEFRRDVDVEIVTREEYREQVRAGSGGGSGEPSPARTYRQVKYRALFLLGGSSDATERENSNDAASVQGYYHVGRDEIVIVSDAETPTIDEITLSQELFHAYQFRHLVPSRLPADASEDTVTAWVAVVEGDANLVDAIYQRRCERDWQCLRPGRATSDGDRADGGSDENETGGSDDGPGIHMGIYLLQYFPYAEGEQYVREVRAERGWDGVDALYRNLPASTEQVIHRTDDPPGTVALTDRSSDRWEPVRQRGGQEYVTVGEYGLATMFGYTLYDDRNGSVIDRKAFLNVENGTVNGSNPLDYGIDPTSGWDADRLFVYRSAEGSTGYVWRIAWDDGTAAREFVEGYGRLLSYHGATDLGDGVYRIDAGEFAGVVRVERTGRTVTVVGAPTRDGIEGLYPTADAADSASATVERSEGLVRP